MLRELLLIVLQILPSFESYTLPEIKNGIELLEKRYSSSTHYDQALLIYISSSDEVQINVKKAFHIAEYIDGPSISTGYIEIKNSTNIIIKNIDVCDNDNKNESRLLLFDNMNDPYDYYEIPKELYEEDNINAFKIFLDNRHDININFTSAAPINVQWVHARGNYKIYQLGDDSESLIIDKYNFNIQNTKAGHMFAIFNATVSNFNCIAEALNAVIAIYVVPAVELSIISVDLWTESIHCTNTVNCKDLILSYWKFQRQTSIPLQAWAVPAVNKMSGDNGLVFVEKLPVPIFERLQKEYYVQRRNIVESKESIISTVFNQLESDTHYYPIISHTLIKDVENYVLKTVSKLWDLPSDNLEVTGAYGIREYRKNALINWHTDPAMTQPITAIIHVGHGNTEKNTTNWELEIASICIRSNLVNTTRIILNEADVLLLESGKLAHARSAKLHDEFYGNFFVHVREKTWSLPIED